MNNRISKRTLHRLPSYLSLLEEKEKEGVEYISATTIANILGLNHVQVRKDLSCASNAGKPKIGYATKDLKHDLKTYLDNNNTVMAHIARLREKLHEPSRKPKFIKTVWGVGYKWKNG